MARRNRVVDTFALAQIAMDQGAAAAAVRGRELLTTGQLPEDTTHGELRTEVAEYLEMAGDLAGAEELLRDMVDTGERGFCDPRILLAELRHRRGDAEGCDALLGEVWRARPTDPFDYLTASEVQEERGDAAGALRWVNSGAFRLRPPDDELVDGDMIMLLQRRRRLREEMGFVPDEFDDLAADAAESTARELEDDWDEA